MFGSPSSLLELVQVCTYSSPDSIDMCPKTCMANTIRDSRW